MEENSDLDQKQMGHYINTCTGKRQGNQDLRDDYLEPRKTSCR